MRVGVIVDSACDLPYSFLKDNGIFIMPITVRIDGETFVDTHDPEMALAFYRSGLLEKGHRAETEAYSADQICELFLREIVTNYDFAFLETITHTRSQIYQNATEAMQRIVASYRPLREAAGRPGGFSMRVVDSGTFFAGQGLLAAHTVHLIKQGIPKNELRQLVSTFTSSLYGCVIPPDLYYIRERARRRGDNSISGVAAFLGKAFNITPLIWGQGDTGGPVYKSRSFDDTVQRMIDYACARIRKGLLSPYVVLTAGMAENDVEKLPGVDQLRQTCAEHGVELLLTPGGITSSIYVGPGSVGLALAAEPHDFESTR